MRDHLPRNIRADATRKNLLESAYQLLNERSFNAVTIDEICAHANVTKGAYYYHFRSKQEILAVLYFEEQDQFFRGEGLREPDRFRSREALAAWLEQYVSLYLRFLSRWDAEIVNEVHRSSLKKQVSSNIEYKWVRHYWQVCNQAAEDGLLRRDLTPQQLHSAIMGWSSGIILLWSMNEREFHYQMPPHLVGEFVSLFLA